MKHAIIASTSTIHGGKPLEYILDELNELYHNTSEILFIPFARPGGISHDDYTAKINTAFSAIGKTAIGIHTFENPKKAIEQAKGIYTGGGNTFVLTNKLHKLDLLTTLKSAINNGTPYLGTSAGSNICGLSIKTTNDMPIVYPPSFQALGLVPFNINPHYLDPDPNSKHMGETRETRIKEFHHFNTNPVVGLREGSWLEVKNESITLKGLLDARIFEYNKAPYELRPEANLTDLK